LSVLSASFCDSGDDLNKCYDNSITLALL